MLVDRILVLQAHASSNINVDLCHPGMFVNMMPILDVDQTRGLSAINKQRY